MRFFPPALAVLALASVASLAATEAAPVAFESFTYRGRDAVFDTPLPPGSYRNPILAGYYPDPSICRVGDDYYLINSSFAHFPGIPIFHSRDLVNWQQIGHVIDRPDQLKYDGLGLTRGIFAPAISHHDGVFYVVCTMVDGGGNFLVTATNPAGPWSDPIWLGFDGIDPSLFFDDDGKAWLVNNGNPPDNRPLYQGHRAIWIQQFDPATKKLVGPRSIIVNGGADITTKPVWIEGPHLYKRAGWYYLCCAEGGTSSQHSQVILRSKSPTGPFTPWSGNPILTQRDLDGAAPNAVTCTGHADLVIGPDGNWWSVFLACRPYAPDRWATGRETFLLPVQWTDDGWPVILPHGERVPYVVGSPRGAAIATNPAQPLNGNFEWVDKFKAPTLSPLWVMMRTPKTKWWDLSDGHLRMQPQAASIGGTGNPSFLGRRLQHAVFDTAVTLRVPGDDGVQAGLAVSQSENQYFQFQVRRAAGTLSVSVVRCNQGRVETIAQKTIAPTDRVTLSLHGDRDRYRFSYTTGDGEPTLLIDGVDSFPVTVQAAGGGLHFTGALIGLFAQSAP